MTNYSETIYRDRNIYQDMLHSIRPNRLIKKWKGHLRAYLFCKADIRKKTPKISTKTPPEIKNKTKQMK